MDDRAPCGSLPPLADAGASDVGAPDDSGDRLWDIIYYAAPKPRKKLGSMDEVDPRLQRSTNWAFRSRSRWPFQGVVDAVMDPFR